MIAIIKFYLLKTIALLLLFLLQVEETYRYTNHNLFIFNPDYT